MKKIYYCATSAALICLLFFSNSCNKTKLISSSSDPTLATSSDAVTVTTAASCVSLKQRPVGMTWRDSLPPDGLGYRPYENNGTGPITNAIFQLTWNDLQPTILNANGTIDQVASSSLSNIRWNLIDKAINNWTSANPGYPGVPLRLYSGIDAPNWVKALGHNEADAGEPLIMKIWVNPDFQPDKDSTKTCTRYWTADYINAHDILVKRIANRYESNSKLIAFYAFGFGTGFNEYCINGMSENVDVYRRNGMTTQKMKTAITHFLNLYNTEFPTTHIILWSSLAYFQGCTDGTGGAPRPTNNTYTTWNDQPFVASTIKLFQSFGQHAINGDNDLDDGDYNPNAPWEVQQMINAGTGPTPPNPIGHQTRAKSRLSSVYQTCLDGVSSIGGNAVFIELPATDGLSLSQLRTLTNKAKNNNQNLSCPTF